MQLRGIVADTRPLLNYYRERGILIPIDATRPMHAVTKAIMDRLRS